MRFLVDYRWPILAILAAALLLGIYPRNQHSGGPDCVFGERTYSDPGQALVHGFCPARVDIAAHMPLSSLPAAWLRSAGASDKTGFLRLRRLARPLVAAVAVAAAGPLWWAALPAAAWESALFGREPACHPQFLYALLVLLVAGLAAYDARRRTRRSALLLGLGLAASLTMRSALAFYPLVWAVLEWRSRRKLDRWRLIAGVCVPYAMLLPWMWANWAVSGRLVFLEAGAASLNVIGGALGLVGNFEGDARALGSDIPADLTRSGEVLWWAVRETVSHPIRYAVSVVRRVFFVIGLYPVWWGLAVFGFWRGRNNAALRATAVFTGYFVLVHCLMVVQAEYFYPVEALLAMGAGVILLPAGKPAVEHPGWMDRAATAGLMTVLGAALVSSAIGMGAAVSFAFSSMRRAPGSARALEEAVGRSPGEPWLRFERGLRRFRSGAFADSETDLEMVLSRKPGNHEARLLYAWVRFLRGDGAPLEALDPLRISGAGPRMAAHVLKAEALARAKKNARAGIERAFATWRNEHIALRGPGSAAFEGALASLRAPGAGVVRLLEVLGFYRPADGAMALVPVLLSWAREHMPEDSLHWRSVAIRLQDLEVFEEAEAIYSLMLERSPNAPTLLTDRGVVRYLSGDAGGAVADFKEALAGDPDNGPALLSLVSVYRGQNNRAGLDEICVVAADRAYRRELKEACRSAGAR